MYDSLPCFNCGHLGRLHNERNDERKCKVDGCGCTDLLLDDSDITYVADSF